MDQQQRHAGDVSADDLSLENGNGLPAQRDHNPVNNSDFQDDASLRNSHINSSQDTDTGHPMPMEVVEAELNENVNLESNSVTQQLNFSPVIGEEDNFATTQSYMQDAKVRRRTTDKWICMFQITGALDLQSEGEAETSEITDPSEIAKIDNYLLGFFQAYNQNIRDVTKHNYKVIQALGSRYIFHANNKILTGVVVVGGNGLVENLRLNSHLLLEKSSPSSPLLYRKYHNVYIGHAYPIHTDDVVCIGGNSLRDLLKNWVNEKFYQSLHWIIPSTSRKMRSMVPLDAKAKEEEDLLKYKDLIKIMVEEVLSNPRTSLKECNSSPLKRSQTNQSNSLYEFGMIEAGKAYSVKSHHWEVIEVPCNADNTVNDVAQRKVLAIKQKGGVIKRVSE